MTNNNDWQMMMMNQLMGQQKPQPNSYRFAPHYEIIRVNGRAGAENFSMGPNSNFLLLDNTAPIIWFVMTDGSGLLTATPFDYSVHQDPPQVNVNDLLTRIQNLEDKLNEQSNSGYTKQQRKTKSGNGSESATQTSNTTV